MINGIKPILSPQTPTPKKPVVGTSRVVTKNGLSFDDAMETLLGKIQENYDNQYGHSARRNSYRKLELSLKPGRKFVKVVEGSRVWGFIAKVDGVHKGLPMLTGDILKAATWNAPAKHSRGSIFDAEMHKSFSWTGPNYL